MKTFRFMVLATLAMAALSAAAPIRSWVAGAVGYLRREATARAPVAVHGERIASLITAEQAKLDTAAGDLANMKASATAMTASREDLRGEIGRLESRLAELEPEIRKTVSPCTIRGRQYTRAQVEAEAEFALGRLTAARQQADALDKSVVAIRAQIQQFDRAIAAGDVRLAAMEHERVALEWKITASEACSRIAELTGSFATGPSGELMQAMEDFQRRAVAEQAMADRRLARADGSPGTIDWETGEALADRIQAQLPQPETLASDSP